MSRRALTLLLLIASPSAWADDCAAMRDSHATIEDATRCALARGWQTQRLWVQISEWQADAGDAGLSMRIMCAAPSYLVDGERRRAYWKTATIHRRRDGSGERYSIGARPGERGFAHLVDAGNAVCGDTHLPRTSSN